MSNIFVSYCIVYAKYAYKIDNVTNGGIYHRMLGRQLTLSTYTTDVFIDILSHISNELIKQLE